MIDTERLAHIKSVYSGVAIVLMMLGLMLLIKPGISAAWFFRLGGIVMIGFGIVRLCGYFSKDLLQLAFQFDFAVGLIACLIGIIMVLWGQELSSLVCVCIGLFLVADALLRIQTALDARQIGLERWPVILVIALLAAVIGILLVFRPYQGVRAITRLIGLNLIIEGILNLYVVRNTVNTIRRKMEWEP